MSKLRGLKDRIAHKGHEAELQDVSNEDDNAFLHKTSQETGAAANMDKRDKSAGPKSVY